MKHLDISSKSWSDITFVQFAVFYVCSSVGSLSTKYLLILFNMKIVHEYTILKQNKKEK